MKNISALFLVLTSKYYKNECQKTNSEMLPPKENETVGDFPPFSAARRLLLSFNEFYFLILLVATDSYS